MDMHSAPNFCDITLKLLPIPKNQIHPQYNPANIFFCTCGLLRCGTVSSIHVLPNDFTGIGTIIPLHQWNNPPWFNPICTILMLPNTNYAGICISYCHMYLLYHIPYRYLRFLLKHKLLFCRPAVQYCISNTISCWTYHVLVSLNTIKISQLRKLKIGA